VAITANLTGCICDGLVICHIQRGRRSRELDPDVVPILQSVDLTALRSNQISVVLCGYIKNVSRLIFPLLAHINDPDLGSIGLGFGAFDFHLTVIHFNIDIELFAQLVDVLPSLTNQEISKFLGEIKANGVTSLEIILFLLLDKCVDLLGQGLDIARAAAKSDFRLPACGFRLLSCTAGWFFDNRSNWNALFLGLLLA